MTISNFEHILKEIVPYTDYVYLHVKGEPLLHPNLDNILELCKEYGLYANITTNGTLISKQHSMLLHAPALRQINFSLHSFEDKNSPSNTLDSYIYPILEFSKKISEETKGISALRLWNYDNQIEDMEKNNLPVIKLLETYFNTHIDLSQISRGIKLIDRVYLNREYKFEWPDMDIPILSSKGFCYGLSTQAAILVDGSVVPCCLDNDGEITLGNIFNTPFHDILNSKRAQEIVQGFKNGQITEELCKRCGYRHRFT